MHAVLWRKLWRVWTSSRHPDHPCYQVLITSSLWYDGGLNHIQGGGLPQKVRNIAARHKYLPKDNVLLRSYQPLDTVGGVLDIARIHPGTVVSESAG